MSIEPDIDKLMSMMLDDLISKHEKVGDKTHYQKHLKNCAECRDRFMTLMDKVQMLAFQQPFFLKGIKIVMDRVMEHTQQEESK